MSTALPIRTVERVFHYAEQEWARTGDWGVKRPLTPKQSRRIRHKNNRIMGANGKGKITPKQIKNRQVRPAPRQGLHWLLSPRDLRKRVKANTPANVTWKTGGHRPDTVIIDDPVRPHAYVVGKGDR